MEIKAVLFDFDGVLTTDASGSLQICKYIAKTAGIDFSMFSKAYREYNERLLRGQITHNDIWRELCQTVGMVMDIGILHESFINAHVDNEMIELVRNLKKKGYVLGIVTDNKKDRIDAIANHFKWLDLFDTVVVSADVGSCKTDEQIFVCAVRKLAVTAEACIFIDNMEANLVIPRSLGMTAIHYDHEKRNLRGLIEKLCLFGVTI